MADKRVDQLDDLDALAGADSFPVRDASATTELKEVTATQIETFIGAQAKADAAQAAAVQRANHTGTQAASTITNFATEVAATASVTANTAKTTNATHTGDVTGATALTIADDAVTNAKLANVATSTIKGRVTAATGDPEDLTATQVRMLLNVEDGANVTNTTNVTAAGALMDSEVDADIKTLALPANTTISAFGASLIDDADAATARATLGVGTGTGDMVAANNLSDLTNAATARTNLGVAIGTNVQAQDAELSAIAGLTSAADALPYFTGSGTASLATFTAAGRNLVDDADAAAQRTTLGVSATADTVLKSLTTTKGDLIAATGADTPARLAVGTNGHVLTVDSAEATGVKWAAAAGGGGAPTLRPLPTGTETGPVWHSTQLSGGFATNGTSWWIPFTVDRTLTLASMTAQCTTLEAGSTLRLGIYTATTPFSAADLLLDAGTVSGDSTGTKTISALSTSLPAGQYLLCGAASAHSTVRWGRYASMLGTPWGFNVGTIQPNAVRYSAVNYSAGLPASMPSVGWRSFTWDGWAGMTVGLT